MNLINLMIISKNEMIGEGQKEKINHFSTCSFCSKYVLMVFMLDIKMRDRQRFLQNWLEKFYKNITCLFYI